MCSPKVLLLVFLFVFFTDSTHSLLAASISDFLTANFHVLTNGALL